MEILAMQTGQHLPVPWKDRARTLRVLRHELKGTLRNRARNQLTLMAGGTGVPSAGSRRGGPDDHPPIANAEAVRDFIHAPLLNRVVPAFREGIAPQDSVRTFQYADEGPLLLDGLDAVLRARGDEAAGRRQQRTHEPLVASDEEDEYPFHFRALSHLLGLSSGGPAPAARRRSAPAASARSWADG